MEEYDRDSDWIKVLENVGTLYKQYKLDRKYDERGEPSRKNSQKGNPLRRIENLTERNRRFMRRPKMRPIKHRSKRQAERKREVREKSQNTAKCIKAYLRTSYRTEGKTGDAPAVA